MSYTETENDRAFNAWERAPEARNKFSVNPFADHAIATTELMSGSPSIGPEIERILGQMDKALTFDSILVLDRFRNVGLPIGLIIAPYMAGKVVAADNSTVSPFDALDTILSRLQELMSEPRMIRGETTPVPEIREWLSEKIKREIMGCGDNIDAQSRANGVMVLLHRHGFISGDAPPRLFEVPVRLPE